MWEAVVSDFLKPEQVGTYCPMKSLLCRGYHCSGHVKDAETVIYLLLSPDTLIPRRGFHDFDFDEGEALLHKVVREPTVPSTLSMYLPQVRDLVLSTSDLAKAILKGAVRSRDPAIVRTVIAFVRGTPPAEEVNHARNASHLYRGIPPAQDGCAELTRSLKIVHFIFTSTSPG